MIVSYLRAFSQMLISHGDVTLKSGLEFCEDGQKFATPRTRKTELWR